MRILQQHLTIRKTNDAQSQRLKIGVPPFIPFPAYKGIVLPAVKLDHQFRLDPPSKAAWNNPHPSLSLLGRGSTNQTRQYLWHDCTACGTLAAISPHPTLSR